MGPGAPAPFFLRVGREFTVSLGNNSKTGRLVQIGSSVKDWVTIDGKTYDLTVSWRTATRWQATGQFGPKHLVGVGTSHGTAVGDWERKALSEDAPPEIQ